MTQILLSCLMLFVTACAARHTPPAGPVTPSGTPPPGAVADRPSAPSPLAPDEEAWQKVVKAAQQEGRVTLYTFAFTGDSGVAVSRGFESRYGIKVEMMAGVGATLLERIKTEYAARRYIADAYNTVSTFLITAKTDGLTQPPGTLPALKEKASWTMFPQFDPEGHLYVFAITGISPYVNINLVKPEDRPKGYYALLEPRWKGRITGGIPATNPSTIYPYAMGKKLKFLDEDYFVRLAKQDVKWIPSVRDQALKVSTGEAEIGFVGGDATLAPFIKEGAPVRLLEMEEGIITIAGQTIAMLKQAPHPNATKLFINWLLSPEGQRAYHEARATKPMLQDMPDFSPPQVRASYKKALPMDLATMEEVSRLQREMFLDKLMGLAK